VLISHDVPHVTSREQTPLANSASPRLSINPQIYLVLIGRPSYLAASLLSVLHTVNPHSATIISRLRAKQKEKGNLLFPLTHDGYYLYVKDWQAAFSSFNLEETRFLVLGFFLRIGRFFLPVCSYTRIKGCTRRGTTYHKHRTFSFTVGVSDSNFSEAPVKDPKDGL
jgi:hypothetical protein